MIYPKVYEEAMPSHNHPGTLVINDRAYVHEIPGSGRTEKNRVVT